MFGRFCAFLEHGLGVTRDRYFFFIELGSCYDFMHEELVNEFRQFAISHEQKVKNGHQHQVSKKLERQRQRDKVKKAQQSKQKESALLTCEKPKPNQIELLE